MLGVMFGFYIGTQSFFTFPKEFIGESHWELYFPKKSIGNGFAIVFPGEVIGKVVSVGVPVRAPGSLDEVAFPEKSIRNYRKNHSSQR